MTPIAQSANTLNDHGTPVATGTRARSETIRSNAAVSLQSII